MNSSHSEMKMVIAKANNTWISTVEINSNEMDNTKKNEAVTECQQISVADVKKEVEADACVIEGPSEASDVPMITFVDPLLLEMPSRRRRRKGSGPKCETSEERAMRLAKMSAYAAQRLANESPEQRALRLQRMSEYAAKRLSQETKEQRAKRLSRMSEYAAKRLANETPGQRALRLTRMSAYAARRHSRKKNNDGDGSESSDCMSNSFE